MPENIRIKPKGVCASRIVVESEGGRITNAVFEGGCDGNGKALGILLRGLSLDEAVARLSGIKCEDSEDGGTSCADQLALGLSEWLEKNQSAQTPPPGKRRLPLHPAPGKNRLKEFNS
ncbi:MAG: TIGR03905 family TSCPD domain-containing protein [Planctomycetota bacterium]|jgi:uncharacterized protein (TIGR03905 family)|nr:TIGR03905 family TSCPD domain-containing protein [Planctomycetota bacterium]